MSSSPDDVEVPPPARRCRGLWITDPGGRRRRGRVRSVASGQFAAEGVVHAGAVPVEADDLDLLAAFLVLGGDGVEGGNGGGVPDVGVGEVDDHVVGITGVVE